MTLLIFPLSKQSSFLSSLCHISQVVPFHFPLSLLTLIIGHPIRFLFLEVKMP